jgi:hypothetical protein
MTARTWVRNLFARTPRRALEGSRKAPARFRPRLEALEGRVVPSGPDTTRPYITSIDYGGTGTPQGTVGQEIADNRLTATLICDSFRASTGPGVPITESRKDSSINLNLHLPTGTSQFAVEVDVRGYVRMPSGETAEVTRRTYFPDLLQSTNNDGFAGPIDSVYHVHDSDTFTHISTVPTGTDIPLALRVRSQLFTTGSSLTQAVGQITVDSMVFVVIPSVSVPAQTAFEHVNQVVGGISVSGAGDLSVNLAVGGGTLTLGDTSGLIVQHDVSGAVTLSGNADALNAALATLTYRGNVDFSGLDTLTVTLTDGTSIYAANVLISVESAEDQAANLRGLVEALGVLNQGQANSLLAKLDLKDNNGDAGKVQAFLNEVTDLLNNGVLTRAQADTLLGPGNTLLLSVSS